MSKQQRILVYFEFKITTQTRCIDDHFNYHTHQTRIANQNKEFLFEFDCNFLSIEFIRRNEMKRTEFNISKRLSPLDIIYRLWICDAHSTMFRNQNCLQPPKHFIWLRKDEILHNFSVYLFKISGPIDIDYTERMMVWWMQSVSFRMDDLMWNDVVRFGKLSFANGKY